ncbi:hypothetical protein MBLNU13_g07402t1 [Cladosporium sp. NU13]
MNRKRRNTIPTTNFFILYRRDFPSTTFESAAFYRRNAVLTETMKNFITILLVALASLCLVQNADAWQGPRNSDPIVCYQKSPDVHSAITNFCSRNSKLVAPSRKAADGAWSDKNKISVWIHGKNCKPPQWIPEKWCFHNFYNMCVNMSKNYKATAFYGKDGGCQVWRIKQF